MYSTKGERAAANIRHDFGDLASDVFLSDREVAALGFFSRNTLRMYRLHGLGPPATRFGRSIRYKVADVRRWLAERHAEAGPNQQGTRKKAPPADR